jgi:hypothetical protein
MMIGTFRPQRSAMMGLYRLELGKSRLVTSELKLIMDVHEWETRQTPNLVDRVHQSQLGAGGGVEKVLP